MTSPVPDPDAAQPPAQPDMWTTASRIVYQNPWMRVREDRFQRRNGTTGTYGVVDKPDFSIVVAEQDGLFHLVEQFRYAIGRRSWEFPMGGWPAGRSGTMLELAQAELREETGLTAGRWTPLGRLRQAPGYGSQGFEVFSAGELTSGAHDREDTEFDMVHGAVTEAQLRAMILDGTIVDSTTVAAYGLYHLRRSEPARPTGHQDRRRGG